jgi:IclR family transcriptional regulator, pca regulon regulatory protein
VAATGETLDGDRAGDNIVRSLERGLAVIGALGVPGPGRTATDVAGELGLSRATTYRALGALCRLGLVRHDAGRFALTPKVLELGYRQWSGLDLAEIAKPHLEELLEQTGEACSVSVLDGDRILAVAGAAPARLVGVAATAGTRLPAYATSQGRVLLAALSPDELSAHLSRVQLRPLTRATITNGDALASMLERVRRSGWSLVDQELEPGLRTIAVPIADARGVVAATGIVVDARRVSLRTMRRALLPVLRAAADRIESDLALSVAHAPGAPRSLARSVSR